MRRVFHILGGGVLTHRNGRTLFEKLNMSMTNLDTSSNRLLSVSVKVWLTRCPNCSLHYLVCGQGEFSDILDQVQSKLRNPITAHMRNFGHNSPSTQIPHHLDLDAYDNIPPQDRVVLMRAVFESLGIECISTGELTLIPRFVRLGLDRYLQSYTYHP